MTIKNLLLTFFCSFFLFSCTQDTDITVPRNLQEYIDASSNNLGETFAYAASASGSASTVYIYAAPEDGATDLRYYEADSLNVDDENDFTNYRRQNLTVTGLFDGKLQRFTRLGEDENWCLVTYMLDGELKKSAPIRLKNASKLTSWTNNVTIEFTETLKPKFTWTDIVDADDAIYFAAISKVEDNSFVSGTYTLDKTFQYFDTSNVEVNINTPLTPDDLVEDTEYLFTMMAISADNWVNTVIEETFIPRNLQEYLDFNSEKTLEKATAFAASASGSESLTYIYYDHLIGASAMRYYETDNLDVDKNDFSKYRRKSLTDAAVYGGELRRYSRTDTEESWCIVTFVVGDKLYKSAPVKIKILNRPTEWLTELSVDFPETLKPKFTWLDGKYLESTNYLQVITDSESNFLSGTFTENKTFQYYVDTNVIAKINLETPADLIFDDEYNVTVMGISEDNWVNLVIQESFIVE
ncbi:hypothetical protein [Polaribacter sp. L3A8]|uniref:hypothetical protein n=1 Tax=Polaribacter sp. L3A8 TaxID=2686361 RepID=UPI00131C1132|nr:hypothetical protein [Polaribacter sp. L3A8]